MNLLKKKKPTPAENIQHVAKITASVKELLKNKVIKIVGNAIYLHPELWYNKSTAEAWIKNLYMYCCLHTNHSKSQPLYFKNIETEEIIGFYQDEKPKVLI
jgi:hypothetical protein